MFAAAVAVQVRWCAPCQSDQPFHVPPCEDGHDAECLDLACAECGHAIVVGVVAVLDAELPVQVVAA